MKVPVVLSVALLTLAAPTAARAKAPEPKPITIDDVMRLRIVGAIEANPAGPGAVVQLQDYDGGARFQKDLWWVQAGQAPRRLTTGGRTRGAFALSPDGRHVAFAGERNGRQGIFEIPLDGGEARLIAELPLDADALRWVGGRIYFAAGVLPDCKADLACTRKRLEERAQGPSARVYDDLYFRPWDNWADGTRSQLFRVDVEKGTVEPAVLGAFDVPPLPFGGVEDYVVAADGTVVYTAKRVADVARSTNTDLFARSGTADRRLTDNPAADRGPVLSPDGTRVAYLAQAVPGFESDLWRLVVQDLKSGERFVASEGIDDWVHEAVWSPDGRALWFVVEQQAHESIWRVEARKGAKPERVTTKFTDRRLSFGGDGLLYFTRETVTQPPDVWTLDPATGAVTRVTAFNGEALAGVAVPTATEAWFDGAVVDGKRQKVHALVVRPAGAAGRGKLPLVVMVHGGPQGSFLDAFHPRWNPLPFAARGFVVVLPNITGSTGYGQPFVNAVSKDWGGRPYEDLVGLLDYAATMDGVDATRACALGGSYGGYMMDWLEGHTDRFKCLVSHAGPSSIASMYGSTDELWFPEWDVGGTPWENPEGYAKVTPVAYAKAFRTPMLVIHGANDFRVPLEQGLIMFTTLKRLGVEAKLAVFPDENHFVQKPVNRKFWYDLVGGWLADHLR